MVSVSGYGDAVPRGPRFMPLLAAGTFGAAAGGGVLLLVGAALQERLADEARCRYADRCAEEELALAALYLLPWIGSTVGVLAVGPDYLEGYVPILFVGGGSLLLSAAGVGAAAVLGVENRAGRVLGLVVGAGAGAALGYLAAHRYRGQYGRAHAAGLLTVDEGRWSVRVPAMRWMRYAAPGGGARAVSLLTVHF